MPYEVIQPVLDKIGDDATTAQVDGSAPGGSWIAFPDSNDQYALGQFHVPTDVKTDGTVTFRIALTPATADAAKNVAFRFSHAPLADGEIMDVSAAWTNEDSGDILLDNTQGNLTLATWTETISNLGWVAGDLVVFRLQRIAPSGADLVGDVLLIGDSGGGFNVEIPELHTVPVPWNLTAFIEANTRFDEERIWGAFVKLSDADTLADGDSITVTKGTGKIILVVNAGADLAGDVTFTGTSVDRETGAETGVDTNTITLAGVTTDASGADAKGNITHVFTNAYITSKWFTGSVVISTTEVNLSDVDVWAVSFEQVNDLSGLTLETFDITLTTTNANAWLYSYLYSLEVTGDACAIALQASLSIADGDAVADQPWRLRRGNIAKALDGATDGLWVELFFGPANQTYFDDISIKTWGTVDVEVE